MRIWWFLLCLGLSNPALAAETKAKGGWFGNIRYAVGLNIQLGADPLGAPVFSQVVLEPAAFELRSFFTPRVAWHTTLNVFRMLEPAIARGEGRLDYDLHVGAHLPVAPRRDAVLAPGASIGYAFSGNYQRFTGDIRLGVDLHGPEGLYTTSVLVRPYAGWGRAPDETEGRPIAGALVEVVLLWRLPKRDKAARAAR